MTSHRSPHRRDPRGFSLLELMIVLTIMGVLMAVSIPRLNLSTPRVEAIAQQVQSVFQTAQRTSLTRQYDIIISIDTVRSELRIAEDVDNSGTIDAGEVRYWRPTGQAEGNIFAVPPVGINTPVVTTSVVGSSFSQVNGLPSITFHRDGSSSSDAEVYVANASKGRVEFRCITLTRSTGRSDMFKLSGSGSTATWVVAR